MYFFFLQHKTQGKHFHSYTKQRFLLKVFVTFEQLPKQLNLLTFSFVSIGVKTRAEQYVTTLARENLSFVTDKHLIQKGKMSTHE